MQLESATFDNGQSVYAGWYDPAEDWNGFSCPVFDYDTAVQILDDLVADDASDCVEWAYDDASKAFTLHGDLFLYPGEDWTSEYELWGTVEADGGDEVDVYSIGAYEWTWLPVDRYQMCNAHPAN